MKVAIHQPHYFPWLGYFDKMAKVDAFVLLDQVQMEKGSYMTRNRIIGPSGDMKLLTITLDKRGYCDKEYCEIPTVDNKGWKQKHFSMLREYYRKAPAYAEMIEILNDFYQKNDFPTVCEWTIASTQLVQNLLQIQTKLILQSDVDYDRVNKKSDMDMEICLALKADTYFSGRGASFEYLNREKFQENGLKIVFQDFQHPVYPQINTTEFVPGVSSLDMLFNCGIEESRRIFWENVHRTHEFND